ncbi:alpha-glucosidase [Mesobacillus maritimus]|uniref:glycoside hydrolase family 13 protein n=1 Tax=Mesobacillus maritimus TaxID=1643336 RepID=UPI00203D4244|nr:alpha-glucosidase [Mesobacillus maritimus]MCM3585920.1 alpha-glucosidase [Mesobacillus maritimus]
MNENWWKESVVYQIYPRSFMDSNGDGIGDLQGIISKLDYLKKLGIDVIWLSPVYKSPNDDNGYDISDYQDIMDEFGTMADWEELLKEVHNRGMKLIMDLVVNHSSDEHPWFIEAKKSPDNPYRDYYIWRQGKDGKEPTNWYSNFGGSAWEYDEQSKQYYLHLFSKKQPDLNWRNPSLREDIYKMMKWWLDKGIDGFRMDVINFISKPDVFVDGEPKEGKKYASGSPFYRNGPHIHDYLQEMNEKVLSQYDVMTVGEMPGVTPELAQLYTAEDRKELNMVFQFEHMGLDNGPNGKWDLKPLNLVDLKANLTKWQKALEQQGWNSLYFNNHDQPRSVTRFGNDKEYRKESAKMLATVLHMMKGTPYVYQGEELGMTNIQYPTIDDYKDIEILNFYREMKAEGVPEAEIMASIYAKGRDNSRTPMQWNREKNGGFTTGTPWMKVNPNYVDINAEEALNDENSVYYYYQKLIQLRKTHEVILHGDYELLHEEHPDLFVYKRILNEETLLVICNFAELEVFFDCPVELKNRNSELLITNYESKNTDLSSTMNLAPYEAKVFLVK